MLMLLFLHENLTHLLHLLFSLTWYHFKFLDITFQMLNIELCFLFHQLWTISLVSQFCKLRASQSFFPFSVPISTLPVCYPNIYFCIVTVDSVVLCNVSFKFSVLVCSICNSSGSNRKYLHTVPAMCHMLYILQYNT